MLQDNFKIPAHVQAAAEAIPQIDRAIEHLKTASRMDDKSLGQVPPPEKNLQESGLFHRVNDLLRGARHDVGEPESDPVALKSRDLALKDIDAAIGIIAPIL